MSALDEDKSTSYTESDYLTSFMTQSEDRIQTQVVI